MKKKRIFNRAAALWMILSCIAFLPNIGKAQSPFSYQAELDTVKQAAFYKITLTPELVAKCRQDLADLRISNREGAFIPYVLKSDLPVLSTEGFREFPILSNEQLKDSSTEVVIENGASASLNYLLLVMKNSSAHRTATLSGSDDRRKWYAIREHIGLEEAGSDTADHFIQSVGFPSSSYRYFKVILNDKGLLPLHILKAGMYARSFTSGLYEDVTDPVIRQKDSSDKHSYITLLYKEAYRIDKLDLGIRGPALYKRYARIYDNNTTGGSPLMTIALDPLNTTFRIPPVKTTRLLIDISNQDNAPLVIERATSSQLDQYLLVYLQPGQDYRLLAGNARAAAPDYDLKYFTDSLTRDPQEMRSGALRPVSSGQGPAPVPGRDHSGIVLWSIITGVLLLLSFLSFKMIKAIPEKK